MPRTHAEDWALPLMPLAAWGSLLGRSSLSGSHPTHLPRQRLQLLSSTQQWPPPSPCSPSTPGAGRHSAALKMKASSKTDPYKQSCCPGPSAPGRQGRADKQATEEAGTHDSIYMAF